MSNKKEPSSISNTSIKMREKVDGKIILPKGSTVVKKSHEITIEQIENGYLIEKEIRIEYQTPKTSYTDYKYCTKKWYSKECPIELESKEKELADLFD